MNIETFIEEHGETISGTITVTYNTRQTFEQLIEITGDGGDDPDEITEDEFLEYVRSNVTDYIAQDYNEGGQIALDGLVKITGDRDTQAV